jgi:hypothetical protein
MKPLKVLLVVGACLSIASAQVPTKRTDAHPKAGANTTQAVPFDLRGVQVGMTKDEAWSVIQKRFVNAIKTRGPGACENWSELSCDDTGRGTQYCHISRLCEGGPTDDLYESLSFGVVDNRLAQVSFSFPREQTVSGIETGFESLTEIGPALVDKYGKPSAHIDEDFQTRGGANYTSHDIRWDNGVSTVRLEELCSNLDESCLTVTHKTLQIEYQKRGIANKPDL